MDCLFLLSQVQLSKGSDIGTLAAVAILFVIVFVVLFLLYISRFRKCPSDRVMVIFGKTGQGASKCIHGGATFVWPVVQDYGFLSLRPMQIEVNLNNALCKQNIRINVPSVFTVAISSDPVILKTAAERLLGQTPESISGLAKDIIFGQLRLVIASLTIEEINSDRENFLREIEKNLTAELAKIGLQLLNVNITDITDESGYIDAIGKRAASEAINKARVEVAEEERKGGIGQADANKEQRIRVSQLEALAQTGEANAARDKHIAIKQAEALAQTGEAEADRDRRITVKQADAKAVEGENTSAIEIAKSNALRQEQEAEAYRRAEAARRVAAAMVEKAQFEADEQAQIARAQLELAKQRAEIVVTAEIEKQKIEIGAEAEAEKTRREAKGVADAIFAKFDAEARGNYEILKAKAEGFNKIISACNGDTDAVSKLLLIEKLEEIVKLQAAAISGIKIDKVTVWDSGSKGDGKGATADFLSGMVKSLPALHDVTRMAGLELPDYLGKVSGARNTQVKTSAE